MKLDLRTVMAGEYLFFGILIFSNPDPFFNPQDGLFKAISGGRSTTWMDRPNHLDPLFEIITHMKGAGFLSLVAGFVLSRGDDIAKKMGILRMALYFNLALLLVYGHALFTTPDDNPYFNLPMIGMYTGSFLGYVLWTFTEIVQERAKKEDQKKQRTKARWPRLLGLIALTLFLGPFAILDVFDPHHVDPGKPMAFWMKTTLPDNTKDDLAIFQSRASGAVALAIVCSALEVLLLDRTIERLRWFNQWAVVANSLYLVTFVRAALDNTGYANKKAWTMLSVVTALFLISQVADLLGYWDGKQHANESKTQQQSIKSKIRQEKNIPGLTIDQNQEDQKSRLDVCTVFVGHFLPFGVIMFTFPDVFCNPQDGLIKAISGIGATELDSNHLDPVFDIITKMKGAGLLSLLAGIVLSKIRGDDLAKNAVIRTTLYFNLFFLLLYAHAAIVQENKYLNLPMIGFYAGTFLVYTLWLLTEVINKGEPVKFNIAEKKQRMMTTSWSRHFGLAAFILLFGPFAILDAFDPHHVDPGMPVTFWTKTTLPDNTKDDLAIFQTRAMGAIELAFLCSALEVWILDRTIERLRWFNQWGVVTSVLFLVVFARAAMDDTGYVYQKAWMRLIACTVVFLSGQVVDLLGYWDHSPTHSEDMATTIPKLASIDKYQSTEQQGKKSQ